MYLEDLNEDLLFIYMMTTDEQLPEENIIDDTDNEMDVVPVQYSISSYGVDYSVDGLVKRLNRGDVYKPDFQRDYVWSMTEASKLI